MKYSFIILILTLITGQTLFGQPNPTLVMDCGADCSFAKPSGIESYTASINYFSLCPVIQCTYKWTVTNGEILTGGYNSATTITGVGIQTVNIRWNNVNANGTVKVETSASSSCTNCPVRNVERTIPIRYLGNVGSIQVNGTPYSNFDLSCGTTPITVSVAPVTNATNYAWSLPANWSYSGSGNIITVYPDVNTGGTIHVSASRSDVNGLTTSSNMVISRPGADYIPSISGSDLLCSNSTYVVNNPSGSSISWSANSSILNINSFTGQATAVSNGSAIITATVTTPCSTYVANKQIWVGPPLISGLLYNGVEWPEEVCIGTTINAKAEVPVAIANSTIFNWSGTNVTVLSNLGDIAQIQFNGSVGQNATVTVQVANSCGTYAGNASVFRALSNCGGGTTTKTYPNPANSELIVEFDKDLNRSRLSKSITLYSEKYSKVVKTAFLDAAADEKLPGNIIKLNVEKLPRGVYYLHVFENKIVIEKIRVVLE